MDFNPSPYRGDPKVPHVSEDFFKIYFAGANVSATWSLINVVTGAVFYQNLVVSSTQSCYFYLDTRDSLSARDIFNKFDCRCLIARLGSCQLPGTSYGCGGPPAEVQVRRWERIALPSRKPRKFREVPNPKLTAPRAVAFRHVAETT